MTPRHHRALPLPYGKMDQSGNLSRLSADIPYEDKDLIKGICPKKGILNQLTQNIFHAIVTNLRNNGITYYSPEHEQYLVTLILRGCTAIESTLPPTLGNVYGRVESARAGTTGSFLLAGDPSQEDHPGTCGSETKTEGSTRCESNGEQVS